MASKSKQIKALKAELRMVGGCIPDLDGSHGQQQLNAPQLQPYESQLASYEDDMLA